MRHVQQSRCRDCRHVARTHRRYRASAPAARTLTRGLTVRRPHAARGTWHVARGTWHVAERTAPLARSLVVPARAARRHHGAVERSHGCDGLAGVAHRMTQGQRQARRQPATGCTPRYATGRCRDPKDRAPCPRWNGPTDIRMDGPQAAAVTGAALLAGLADLEGLSANCAAAAGMPTHQTNKRGLTSLSDPFAFCLVGPGRLELPTNGLRVKNRRLALTSDDL